MIVDAHYHLEEQIETVDELLGQMKRNGISRVALIPKMQEPFHLEGLAKKAGEFLPRMLMNKMRFLGLALYNSTVTSDGKVLDSLLRKGKNVCQRTGTQNYICHPAVDEGDGSQIHCNRWRNITYCCYPGNIDAHKHSECTLSETQSTGDESKHTDDP